MYACFEHLSECEGEGNCCGECVNALLRFTDQCFMVEMHSALILLATLLIINHRSRSRPHLPAPGPWVWPRPPRRWLPTALRLASPLARWCLCGLARSLTPWPSSTSSRRLSSSSTYTSSPRISPSTARALSWVSPSLLATWPVLCAPSFRIPRTRSFHSSARPPTRARASARSPASSALLTSSLAASALVLS